MTETKNRDTVNLRIEGISESHFNQDPLASVDLNIWINDKQINNSKVDYLEVVMLPGREEVTANIKFNDLDYFIGSDIPEDWNTKLAEYRGNPLNLEAYSFTTKLMKIRSNFTVIEGLPIDKDLLSTCQGFDIDAYLSGLRVTPSKLKITISRGSPLEVQASYTPSTFLMNVNTNLTINEPSLDYWTENGWNTSLLDSEGVELAKFFQCKVKDNALTLFRGVILNKKYVNKINQKDTYSIRLNPATTLNNIQLTSISFLEIPGRRIIVNYATTNHTDYS